MIWKSGDIVKLKSGTHRIYKTYEGVFSSYFAVYIDEKKAKMPALIIKRLNSSTNDNYLVLLGESVIHCSEAMID